MKANNKQRPDNMAELNFPHKKRGTNGFRKKPLTEKDKFNKTVGEIRILLNKLTNSNFDTISSQLLNFTYNPSLLYELMKMIFIKSTCEHYYLDVYVKLCSMLFKQFNDKDNYEMNFKKLLVSKCQKQFFKMLNKEREERKKRKDSMTQNPEQKPVEEEEFSKPMMYLFDDEELKERKKEQMYGNMYLITELYVAKQLTGNIIKTCLDDLQQEINDQNVEIMCYMVNKLMEDLCSQAKAEYTNNVNFNSAKFLKKGNKVINLEYADNMCLKLFEHRRSEQLSSRIKFKIQDLIDAYNKEWRIIIAETKKRTSDSDGFKQIYVPKDRILTEEHAHRYSKEFEKRKDGASGYFFRAKSPQAGKREVKEPVGKEEKKENPNKMASLLSCLKAEDSKTYNQYIGAGASDEEEEDEEASEIVERRMSVNQYNEAGMNFQRYQEIKPAAGVRREILNMFNEYKELEDKQHAQDELLSICENYSIEKFQFLGYFLSNSLAEKPNDFRQYMQLVFQYFHEETSLLDKKQMKER